MTVPQIIGMAKTHGFAVFCRADGTPTMKPLRQDAVMPDKLMAILKANRQPIREWFTENPRRDMEECSVCHATVSLEMTSSIAKIVCGKVPTKKTLGCPYRDFGREQD